MAWTYSNEGRQPIWLQVTSALLRLLVFFWILYTASFVLFDLGPDAAVRQLGWQAVDSDALEIRRESLGLDGPWHQRYRDRLAQLLTGDLGVSMNGGWEVAPVFLKRLGVSVGIWMAAAFLLIAVPIPLSLAFCSPTGPAWPSRLLRWVAPFGLAPPFLIAAVGYALWKILIAQHMPGGSHSLMEWVLVVFTTSAFPLALVFLAASNSAGTIAEQPFVMVYRAKGLSWFQIRCRIVRNIWIECRVVVWRAMIAGLIGSIFGEFLFGIDGLGRLFLEALRARDLAIIEPWAMLIGCLTLLIVTQERRGRWN